MLDATKNTEKVMDLSDYYIIKKYKHGWHLAKIGTEMSQFISREELINMGYIVEPDDDSNNNIISTTPPSAIIVPTGDYNFNNKSKNSIKSKFRADNDPDWRKSKGI